MGEQKEAVVGWLGGSREDEEGGLRGACEGQRALGSRRGARGEREIRPHVSDDRKPARVLMLFFLTCPVITFNN